jgi:hypothetical protein
MGVVTRVRELAGTRQATRLIASSSRILIFEDCLFSNGTSLITIFDFPLHATEDSEV